MSGSWSRSASYDKRGGEWENEAWEEKQSWGEQSWDTKEPNEPEHKNGSWDDGDWQQDQWDDDTQHGGTEDGGEEWNGIEWDADEGEKESGWDGADEREEMNRKASDMMTDKLPPKPKRKPKNLTGNKVTRGAKYKGLHQGELLKILKKIGAKSFQIDELQHEQLVRLVCRLVQKNCHKKPPEEDRELLAEACKERYNEVGGDILNTMKIQEILDDEDFKWVTDGDWCISELNGAQIIGDLREPEKKFKQMIGIGWTYNHRWNDADNAMFINFCHNPYTTESRYCCDIMDDPQCAEVEFKAKDVSDVLKQQMANLPGSQGAVPPKPKQKGKGKKGKGKGKGRAGGTGKGAASSSSTHAAQWAGDATWSGDQWGKKEGDDKAASWTPRDGNNDWRKDEPWDKQSERSWRTQHEEETGKHDTWGAECGKDDPWKGKHGGSVSWEADHGHNAWERKCGEDDTWKDKHGEANTWKSKGGEDDTWKDKHGEDNQWEREGDDKDTWKDKHGEANTWKGAEDDKWKGNATWKAKLDNRRLVSDELSTYFKSLFEFGHDTTTGEQWVKRLDVDYEWSTIHPDAADWVFDSIAYGEEPALVSRWAHTADPIPITELFPTLPWEDFLRDDEIHDAKSTKSGETTTVGSSSVTSITDTFKQLALDESKLGEVDPETLQSMFATLQGAIHKRNSMSAPAVVKKAKVEVDSNVNPGSAPPTQNVAAPSGFQPGTQEPGNGDTNGIVPMDEEPKVEQKEPKENAEAMVEDATIES